MTTLDVTPGGIDLLAIRVGSTLERWGRERALRHAPHHEPDAARDRRAEVAAGRAHADANLMRIR